MGKLVVLCVLSLLSLTTATPVTYDYDTIVVGLGAAGLATASPISRAGRRVLALEAQDYIGGRVRTVPFGDSVVELGAEWIYGNVNNTVYDLAHGFNVTIVPQVFKTNAYRSDGSKGDSKLMEELVALALEANNDPPNPPQKLGDFIVKKLTDHITKNHAELLNDKDFLTEFFNFLNLVIRADESANDWNDVTTASGYKALQGSQDLSWGKKGFKTLLDILLYRYEGLPGIPLLTIKLNSPVTKISWSQEGVSVTTADGKSYTAKNVVVATSIGVLKEKYSELFTPALPQEKIDAINKIGSGVCDKVILRFEEDWFSGNSFGFIWKGEDRKKYSEEDSWVTNLNGLYPPVSVEKTLIGWICGDAAKKMETLSEDVVKSKVIEVIRKFLGKDFNIPEPVEMIRSTWYNNPYMRGLYSYDNLEAPGEPNIRKTLAKPLADSNGENRVYFAGEATRLTSYGSVHGAVESGFCIAARVLKVSSDETKDLGYDCQYY